LESAADCKQRAVGGGATIANTGRIPREFPILFDRDQICSNEPFLDRD